MSAALDGSFKRRAEESLQMNSSERKLLSKQLSVNDIMKADYPLKLNLKQVSPIDSNEPGIPNQSEAFIQWSEPKQNLPRS